MLQCEKLMNLGLSERREVVEKSGLCTFCLKHAAELDCYGRGGMSKPRCMQSRCDGEHTPSVHKLVGEESVGVNLVAEDESETEDEDEDEGWWGRRGVVGRDSWSNGGAGPVGGDLGGSGRVRARGGSSLRQCEG
jgi:hypothetical protein